MLNFHRLKHCYYIIGYIENEYKEIQAEERTGFKAGMSTLLIIQ